MRNPKSEPPASYGPCIKPNSSLKRPLRSLCSPLRRSFDRGSCCLCLPPVYFRGHERVRNNSVIPGFKFVCLFALFLLFAIRNANIQVHFSAKASFETSSQRQISEPRWQLPLEAPTVLGPQSASITWGLKNDQYHIEVYVRKMILHLFKNMEPLRLRR